MTASNAPPAAFHTKLRWYQPTPGRLLVVLLGVEGVLLLSERFQWFALNEKKGWTVLIAIASVGVAMVLVLLWSVLALRFRWRFQFSIRSLFVLTVAVAIPFSWLAVEMKWGRQQREVVEWIQKVGGGVIYDYRRTGMPNPAPPGPIWLRRLLGDDFFVDVDVVVFDNTQVTDAGLQCLKGLTQLPNLSLDNTQVTDSGLEHLMGLSELLSQPD